VTSLGQLFFIHVRPCEIWSSGEIRTKWRIAVPLSYPTNCMGGNKVQHTGLDSLALVL